MTFHCTFGLAGGFLGLATFRERILKENSSWTRRNVKNSHVTKKTQYQKYQKSSQNRKLIMSTESVYILMNGNV